MDLLMAFDLKSELLAAIDKAADQRDRTMLMLMFGLFEATQEGINEISGKIDMVLRDEQGLREAVLNGHAKNHDRDHTWVDEQIKYKDLASEEHRWVRAKIAAEKEAERTADETAKADRRTARDTVIRVLVSAAFGALVSAVGILLAIK